MWMMPYSGELAALDYRTIRAERASGRPASAGAAWRGIGALATWSIGRYDCK
jgi:hypothetical protein